MRLRERGFFRFRPLRPPRRQSPVSSPCCTRGYNPCMGKRGIIIAAVVLALLVGVVVMVWEINDWPPPRLILKYGFPPTGGPTGNTRVIEGVEFAELKPGYFRMGSHFHCERGDLLGRVSAVFGFSWGNHPFHARFECPTRWVEIDYNFWIARTEVTNEQYERCEHYKRFASDQVRSDYSPGDRHPKVEAMWWDAKAYCAWLSEKTGWSLRLPSEAEWEYACRAGNPGKYCFGDNADLLSEYAWHYDGEGDNDGRGGAQEVATRRPNAWGLHDLHGNAAEWCQDTEHRGYEDAPTDGSAWTTGGKYGERFRILRGGDWGDDPIYYRSSWRACDTPETEHYGYGFRPVFTLEE